MEINKLLEVKRKLNKTRPHFVRQDYSFRMRVQDDIWRKPRGHHSKMRRGEAGKKKMVQAGYRSPVEVRGMTLQGLKLVHIETLQQLEKLNPKTELAILSARLGTKKKVDIVKKAVEKDVKFSNIKDPKKFLSDVEAKLKARKEQKTAKEKKETKAEAKKEQVEDKSKQTSAPQEKPKTETKQETSAQKVKKPEVKK